MEFLQSTILWDNGCLYTKDGLIERLIDMEENEPAKYEQLTRLVTGDSTWALDPQYVYACQATCVCPVGHKNRRQAPDWFPPDITNLNLRAALATLDGAEST